MGSSIADSTILWVPRIQRIFYGRLNPSLLAILVNLPLILSGLPFGSFDAYTHIFFADHYRRTWFNLLEPRWFGGFSVASYPPLVHQLIAILSVPATVLTSLSGAPANVARFWSEAVAYDVVLLLVVACLPLAVTEFAKIFVPARAAHTAGWLAVGLPAFYLSAYSFGQLPTLFATTALLWTLALGWRFAHTGSWRDLVLATVWAGVTAAAHHAVLLLAVFAGAAMVGQVWLWPGSRQTRFKYLWRLALFAACAASFGALVLWPFLLWSKDYVAQTPIDHASRHNFIFDLQAGYYFFWPMYGPLLLALPIMVGWVLNTRRWLLKKTFNWKRLRHLPLVALATLLFILGLGGTTPFPTLSFGSGLALPHLQPSVLAQEA